jgi:sodium transport system ATP-binding protein
MVTVQDLSKSFKTKKQMKQVLDHISFTAQPGNIYGLLGPNGAGKTTTLRLIATLLKPDSGTVTVDGSDTVTHSRAVRDKIGLLTGEMRLSGNLSPRETLRFFGQLNHMDRKAVDERIASLSSYFGMDDYLDRPIDRLSSGMKQKISLAVSIIHDPKVIMFDEPTSNLDILAVKTVIDFLFDERRQGKTIILSTHILSEAEKLCDTVGILLDGQLVVQGSIPSLLEQYHTPRLEDIFFELARERGLTT